jgi:methylase of polypeptide subunit release factors
MDLNQVLNSLQYDSSPNFFSAKTLESDRDFGHVFRKARAECKLHGAYVLNGSAYDKTQGIVPVVYVCEANSEGEAREIHRKVWNQNAVPFLLVVSQGWVRLYPGFKYEGDVSRDRLQGALQAIEDFNQIASSLSTLRAESLDSGRVWAQMGAAVATERRVDWQLLANLRDLDEWLHADGVEDRRLAHAMIGKFVYLRYLRQRGILSDARLADWKIDAEHVFGHNARLNAFAELVQHVEEWLNGSVFPIPTAKIREFGAERIRKVASVFSGEQAVSGQLPLFDVYDFSFIPIETLSVIYEQFLHDRLDSSGESEGEAKSAYYTPLPVVNFMLDKLDSRRPLQPGMRVLDCSCGSGAFLVQCYRKLIERRLQELGRRLRPAELGRLLTHHIFGVDIDEDACQIAELSLALTLLEYVNPPDLTETQFQLPVLRDRNIFCANAFDDNSPWYQEGRKRGFQWIVGNPPWKELKPQKLSDAGRVAWQWIQKERKERPVGGNQIAEAFAWLASEFLDPDGAAALLLPAMTLFKYESTAFRREFLGRNRLWSVANFANLANVLFGGRATLPAAAFFYSPVTDGSVDEPSAELIETYSPMLANQPISQGTGRRARKGTWSIVVNSSEVREIDYRDVATGQPTPWKIAMWGSAVDAKLLEKVQNQFPSLRHFEQEKVLIVSQGPEFIGAGVATEETAELHEELVGKRTILPDEVKGRRFLYRFPNSALRSLELADVFVSRRGGVKRKLSVCQPQQIIVGASRNFAVYTEELLVVPSRQIGIVSPTGDQQFLKALALYLNSDFVAYHQFLTATESGVQKTRGTLESLRLLPLPFEHGEGTERWETLYTRILREVPDRDDFNRPDLVRDLNELTFDALRLSSRARTAVHDLVHVRFGLMRGKVAASAVAPPAPNEVTAYAESLRDDLDSFLGPASNTRHRVEVMVGGGSGLIAVDLMSGIGGHEPVRIWDASQEGARRLAEARTYLIEQRSQWLYFNRNLRVYDSSGTYILKPLQRLHWTRTQAIQDAGEIIADSLRSRPSVPAEGIH